MKNIFLSRPNWISPESQNGLSNFLKILKAHNLSPRTIGTTDFPSKSPMDEVIDLLHQCEGAIILGYNQIEVTSGKVKDAAVLTPLSLSTEWNHIEASLAYALGLPLLLIHDLNITRGIFDRGVLNSFLYRKDFTESSWALSEDISGALEHWKSKLKPVTRLQTKVKEAEKPLIQWGCFKFPPDPSLYCPFCYNKEGEKMLTTRVDIKHRQCTNCGKMINAG